MSEYEADYIWLFVMAKAGFRPMEAVDGLYDLEALMSDGVRLRIRRYVLWYLFLWCD